MDNWAVKEDIIHETATHWVCRELFKGREVFTVWKIKSTHSVKCATFDLGERGRVRAIEDCERRSKGMTKIGLSRKLV